MTARNNGLGDGLGATGLTYRVQVENGEGDVVYDETSDVQAFSVLLNSSDPDNYTITAWVINKYGTSEPIIEVAEVDEFIGTDPPTRTTGTPTDTPRSTTTEEITRDPGMHDEWDSVQIHNDLMCCNRFFNWCYCWRSGWWTGSAYHHSHSSSAHRSSTTCKKC